MNGWIERNAKLRDDKTAETQTVASGMDSLWNSLCRSVFAAAKQYADRFPVDIEPYDFIETSPHDNFDEIWVKVTESPIMTAGHPKLKRSVTVRLDREKALINLHYHGVRGAPIIRIGATIQGTAGFFVDSRQVTIEEATELVLGPILYPDLPSGTTTS
jgi:hypothetical protein